MKKPFPKFKVVLNDDAYSPDELTPIEKLAASQADERQKRELQNLKEFDRCAFNSSAEQIFLDFVHNLIKDEGGEVSRTMILKECSYELNISTETVKRYLLKHTARKASLFETDKGRIRSKRFTELKS